MIKRFGGIRIMLDSILQLMGDNTSITLTEFVVCSVASLVFGLVIALVYMYKNTYSKSIAISLVLLPTIVQLVIMMINGNIGIGIAVAGAFSLIRFRSVPGSARDISSIFAAMAVGLATASGYILVAAVFIAVVSLVSILLVRFKFGDHKNGVQDLKITIPENLDYAGVFDDLFDKYLSSYELVRVRTINMGSLYQLQYQITMKDIEEQKAFMDEVRCRNGNLNIVCGRLSAERDEL